MPYYNNSYLKLNPIFIEGILKNLQSFDNKYYYFMKKNIDMDKPIKNKSILNFFIE
jgi:hypothetical protein